MTERPPFNPDVIFSAEASAGGVIPKVLNSPHKYIQGDGVTGNLGLYLGLLESRHAAVLISEGGIKRIGDVIGESLKRSNIAETRVLFTGECSFEEIERVAGLLASADRPVDSVVAIGGGKCLDTGRSVAYRLSVPVVACPTTASTDAPCAAVSAVYQTDGTFRDVELFPPQPRTCDRRYRCHRTGSGALHRVRNGGCNGYMVRSPHMF